MSGASEKAYDVEQRLNALIAAGPEDSWTQTGALTASWGKGSGYFQYKYIGGGLVYIAAQGLTIGTDTDGTTICTAANGLLAAYRPQGPKQVMASTNALRTGAVGTATEPAWLEIQTGGSIQCFGVAAAATFLNCFGAFPIDI